MHQNLLLLVYHNCYQLVDPAKREKKTDTHSKTREIKDIIGEQSQHFRVLHAYLFVRI